MKTLLGIAFIMEFTPLAALNTNYKNQRRNWRLNIHFILFFIIRFIGKARIESPKTRRLKLREPSDETVLSRFYNFFIQWNFLVKTVYHSDPDPNYIFFRLSNKLICHFGLESIKFVDVLDSHSQESEEFEAHNPPNAPTKHFVLLTWWRPNARRVLLDFLINDTDKLTFHYFIQTVKYF